MAASATQSKRIQSLDLLRGITVAGMITVNNPGSWAHMYAPLKHAEWIGLTPTDLIFPFFLFIMGVSIHLSLSSSHAPTRSVVTHILKRSFLLVLIGWAVVCFSFFLRKWFSLAEDPSISIGDRLAQSLWAFPHMRILGVFPRLGITYGIAALLAFFFSDKVLVRISVTILLLYGSLLLWADGYVYGEANILSRIDRLILTPSHMYSDNGIDPEGVLSTFPAVVQVLIGVLVGRCLKAAEATRARLVHLFMIGCTLSIVGVVVSWGLPLSKKIWSPSFVLVTCGLATLFLAWLMRLEELRIGGRVSKFFLPFGANALFTYLASTVLTLLFLFVRIPTSGGYTTVARWGYHSLLELVTSPELASFLYSLIFLFINWLLGYILYKKRIFIKL